MGRYWIINYKITVLMKCLGTETLKHELNVQRFTREFCIVVKSFPIRQFRNSNVGMWYVVLSCSAHPNCMTNSFEWYKYWSKLTFLILTLNPQIYLDISIFNVQKPFLLTWSMFISSFYSIYSHFTNTIFYLFIIFISICNF